MATLLDALSGGAIAGSTDTGADALPTKKPALAGASAVAPQGTPALPNPNTTSGVSAMQPGSATPDPLAFQGGNLHASETPVAMPGIQPMTGVAPAATEGVTATPAAPVTSSAPVNPVTPTLNASDPLQAGGAGMPAGGPVPQMPGVQSSGGSIQNDPLFGGIGHNSGNAQDPHDPAYWAPGGGGYNPGTIISNTPSGGLSQFVPPASSTPATPTGASWVDAQGNTQNSATPPVGQVYRPSAPLVNTANGGTTTPGATSANSQAGYVSPQGGGFGGYNFPGATSEAENQLMSSINNHDPAATAQGFSSTNPAIQQMALDATVKNMTQTAPGQNSELTQLRTLQGLSPDAQQKVLAAMGTTSGPGETTAMLQALLGGNVLPGTSTNLIDAAQQAGIKIGNGPQQNNLGAATGTPIQNVTNDPTGANNWTPTKDASGNLTTPTGQSVSPTGAPLPAVTPAVTPAATGGGAIANGPSGSPSGSPTTATPTPTATPSLSTESATPTPGAVQPMNASDVPAATPALPGLTPSSGLGTGTSPVSTAATDPNNALTAQTLSVGATNDPVKMAQQAYQTMQASTDPQYQASLRDALRSAAAAGGLGSGALNTSLGNIADQRQNTLATEQGNLLQNALQQQNQNAYANVGIAQQQQGFQNGQQQTAFNQALQQLLTQDQLTNSSFGRAQGQYSAGNMNNPTSLLTALSSIFGQQATGAGTAAAGNAQNTNANAGSQNSTLQSLLDYLTKQNTPATTTNTASGNYAGTGGG